MTPQELEAALRDIGARRYHRLHPFHKLLHGGECSKGHSLADIWKNSPAFNAFRGTSWMKEPCKSCARRDIDFGGCRCQAFALTGDAAATDPVCHLSPRHDEVAALAALQDDAPYTYRRM
jgi:radical SAM protein with 4Fe4S-binding SPASM domain